MLKKLVIIPLLFSSLLLQAQYQAEAGSSWYNFTAKVLQNSTNSNLKGANALYLQYALPLGRGTQVVYRAEIGDLKNIGKPYKVYTHSTLAALSAEIRVPLLTKTISKNKLAILPSLGYTFMYIHKTAQSTSNSITSHVGLGCYLSSQPANLPFAFHFQPSINQRLNNDFRTHFQYRLGISFPLLKK